MSHEKDNNSASTQQLQQLINNAIKEYSARYNEIYRSSFFTGFINKNKLNQVRAELIHNYGVIVGEIVHDTLYNKRKKELSRDDNPVGNRRK